MEGVVVVAMILEFMLGFVAYYATKKVPETDREMNMQKFKLYVFLTFGLMIAIIPAYLLNGGPVIWRC